ncbi:enoyl-CoA hydratase [Sphingomonas sp. Leaf357]|uniref:enoyl-CoA hydratase/isomerase family protein n=1 Tax=Sphingomonas sp. Leaf357 TaxID=1736350 RepID=UPI000701F7E8|nr:enoyl-CoA hydratase/isomerase family protein [Sphingomonas sp. Leaf357]KQS03717.1 enoyl-CoA hydratase [Sphingomonas sp. Leaf357]
MASLKSVPHSDPQPLLFTVDEGIALLTFNRPARGNSLNPDLLLALEEAWARVEADDAIRVVVITGAGEKHFCTGAEVQTLRLGMGGLQNQPYEQANRFSPRMAKVSKPVICAVNGLCNAGGLHFVADSDIVIACRDAQFMDSHVTIGQVSALEAQGIARRAGIGSALLMGLAGRNYRMPAERAWMLGMIDLLEENAAAVMARAMDLARDICGNSPQAMALTKRAIWATTELPDPAAPVHGWELLKSQWAHPDFVEGPKAFEQGRDPVWDPNPNARIKP